MQSCNKLIEAVLNLLVGLANCLIWKMTLRNSWWPCSISTQVLW